VKKYYFLLVLIFGMLAVLTAILFVGARNTDEYFKTNGFEYSEDSEAIGR
jgi:hypothetical protein